MNKFFTSLFLSIFVLTAVPFNFVVAQSESDDSNDVVSQHAAVPRGNLTINSSPDFQSGIVLAGSVGSNVARFVLDATNSVEDLRVKKINLSLTGIVRASDLNSCQIFDGSTAINTGSNIVNPVRIGKHHDFTLDHRGLAIAKGSKKIVDLKCNISTNPTPGAVFKWSVNPNYTKVKGIASGVRISAGSHFKHGPSMSIVPFGSLSVTSSFSPISYNVTAGVVNVPVASFVLSADNEAMQVRQIGFQFDGSSTAVGETFTLWDGSTQVGESAFVSGNGTTQVTLGTNVIVPQDGTKTLTMKINIPSVGFGQLIQPGDTIVINYDGDNSQNTQAVGVASGVLIQSSSTADTAAGGVRVFRSLPQVEKLSLPSNNFSNSQAAPLYRFSVAADQAGDVSLAKLTFKVAAQGGVTIENLSLAGYLDPSFTIPVGEAAAATVSGETAEVYFNDPRTIIAGQRVYFELRGDISNVNREDAVDVIIVSLQGDSTAGPVGTLAETDAGLENDFIWSGNSISPATFDSPDWTNGYLIRGLPAEGIASETLTGAN
ncbi:MAG: hypothetical protein HY454_00870 [Parcubacteria group bacterium]|nr:hypothetical protein [Parcubacteria group bacterium]